jgi:isopentenyldiphosphate isomerase
MSAAASAPHPVNPAEEYFDIRDEAGNVTGEKRLRSEVHALGLLHKAVHVWLWAPSTGSAGGELLLQRRATVKDSWPGRLDISSAGHLSAGQESLDTAQRELTEELGLTFPAERFEFLFTHLERLASTQRGKPFINNEFNDVYLITLTPEERQRLQPGSSAFVLQADEVSDVVWLPWQQVERMYINGDPDIVPVSDWDSYKRVFDELRRRGGSATSG